MDKCAIPIVVNFLKQRRELSLIRSTAAFSNCSEPLLSPKKCSNNNNNRLWQMTASKNVKIDQQNLGDRINKQNKLTESSANNESERVIELLQKIEKLQARNMVCFCFSVLFFNHTLLLLFEHFLYFNIFKQQYFWISGAKTSSNSLKLIHSVTRVASQAKIFQTGEGNKF